VINLFSLSHFLFLSFFASNLFCLPFRAPLAPEQTSVSIVPPIVEEPASQPRADIPPMSPVRVSLARASLPVADISTTPVGDLPLLAFNTPATDVDMDTTAHNEYQHTGADDTVAERNDDANASNLSAGLDKGKAPEHPEQQLEHQSVPQQTPTAETPEASAPPSEH
jgi:hypothetical protein